MFNFGPSPPAYRKFNGQRYELEEVGRSKRDLKREGRKQKKWGWIDKYRVKRSKDNGNYWCLYVR